MTTRILLSIVVLFVLSFYGRHAFGAITEHQASLDKLRPMVDSILYRDWMKTDEYLLKWLKVGGYNVPRTKGMIEKNIAWRKSERIDGLLTEDLSRVEPCIKIYQEGHDRGDRAIIWAQIGAWNVRKCALSGQVPKLTRLAIRNLFEAPQNNSTIGTYVIADLTGFNLRQSACLTCFPLYTALAHHFDHDYPGLHHRVNLINAPRAAEVMWNIVRPILTPQSREAMRYFTPDKNKYGPILLKDVAPDQLPVAFGGQKRT